MIAFPPLKASHLISILEETLEALERFNYIRMYKNEHGSLTPDGQHGGGVSMDKFSGASSISSDDFFGDTQDQRRGGSHSDSFSLRNEVSRVTGKLSTMASGVIGSLKDRYGRQT
eukprot:m.96995 g.96995  ORF g.96995 m.96995 type:complete len:115 (+) comp36928_c0_seq31:1413-1757(+)